MSRPSSIRLCAAAALASLALLGEPPSSFAAPSDAAPPAVDAAPDGRAAAAPLSAASLDALYGTGATDATSVAVSDQMLQASDTGNAVIAGGAISSGTLSLSGGAFGNYNGVGNFVFNTGNNNTLQGSINITVLTPPR